MRLLVTGVTGYIGGSAAVRLKEEGHQIVGLVRSPEQASAVAALGITPFVGDLNAYESLKNVLREVDGVVNAADSDNVYFVTTAIEALRGSNKLFVHTSGSSIVGDKSGGEPGDVVNEESRFSFRPEKAARVAIDRLVLEAAKEGIRSVVICPTMIYGKGLGLKKDSIQLPMLRAAAVRQGRAVHVGRGLNVWSNVHIADLAELYVLAVANAKAGSFFFAENGEASLRDIAVAQQRALGFEGEPRAVPIDEAISWWGPDAAHFAFGANSRVTSARARKELGWSPQRSSIFEAIH